MASLIREFTEPISDDGDMDSEEKHNGDIVRCNCFSSTHLGLGILVEEWTSTTLYLFILCACLLIYIKRFVWPPGTGKVSFSPTFLRTYQFTLFLTLSDLFDHLYFCYANLRLYWQKPKSMFCLITNKYTNNCSVSALLFLNSINWNCKSKSMFTHSCNQRSHNTIEFESPSRRLGPGDMVQTGRFSHCIRVGISLLAF